jgi:hypothetical protein
MQKCLGADTARLEKALAIVLETERRLPGHADHLRRALSHGSDKKFDWGDRGREVESDDDYRVKAYWGIAESW